MTARLILAAMLGSALAVSPVAANSPVGDMKADGGAVADRTLSSALERERTLFEDRQTGRRSELRAALTEGFVGFGAGGRLDKGAWIQELIGSPCASVSREAADARMVPLGQNALAVVYRQALDLDCAGQTRQEESWVASVHVKDGASWTVAYRNEVPLAEPEVAPAPEASSAILQAGLGAIESDDADPIARQLMAIDRQAWLARQSRNARAVENLLSDGFTFVNPVTPEPLGKADTIEAWISPSCEFGSFELSEAEGRTLAEDVAMVSYRGLAHGTCNGVTIESRWVSTFYVHQNDVWTPVLLVERPTEGDQL